jgi:integrase
MSEGTITRRGRRSFRIKWELPLDSTGKRRTAYATVKGTRKAAEQELRRRLTAIDKGMHVEPSAITVTEFMKLRIGAWATRPDEPISPRTAEGYSELLANQVEPFIGAPQVQKLTALDIENWHGKLATSGRKDGQGGVGVRTIRAAHRLLSQALDDAVRHKLVPANEAKLAKRLRAKSAPVEILTEQQCGEIVAKLRGRSIYPMAMVAYGCGMRASEILALRWCNTDIDGRLIRVREAVQETKKGGITVKAPKTEAGVRDISLPDLVVDALREHRRQQLELRMALGLGKLPDDALVFPTLDGDHRSPRSFAAKWSIVAARIGMPEISFHALRHTHASQMIAADINVVTISRRLGHASPNVTLSIYAHLFRQRHDKAADKINAVINAALQRK